MLAPATLSRVRLLATLLPLTFLAGCGAEEERPAAGARSGDGTELIVEVRPQGEGGPVQRRTVREVPPGITRKDFDPVPGDVACTQIFGGPQTARVSGTLRGERVDARFARNDGCEMGRWDKLAPLLGEAAGGPPAPP